MTEFLTWEIMIGDQLKVSSCEKPYNAANVKHIPTLVGFEPKIRDWKIQGMWLAVRLLWSDRLSDFEN